MLSGSAPLSSPIRRDGTEVKREVIGEGIGFLESYIAARLLGETQQMPRTLS